MKPNICSAIRHIRQAIAASSVAVAALLICTISTASAAPILLDFEDFDPACMNDPDCLDDMEPVGNYYIGSGVTFSDSVIALKEFDGMAGSGDIENQPSGETVIYLLADPTQSPDAVVNTNPANAASGILNFAEGFLGSFSFFYSASTEAVTEDGSPRMPTVELYRAENGVGTPFLTFMLTQNWQDPEPGEMMDMCETLNGEYCNWDFVERVFDGIAKSIKFIGGTNRLGFDDITINPVPLPAGVWLLLSGLFGFAVLRRRGSAQ